MCVDRLHVVGEGSGGGGGCSIITLCTYFLKQMIYFVPWLQTQEVHAAGTAVRIPRAQKFCP